MLRKQTRKHPFGVTSSPFLLAATLRLHFQNEHEHFPSTYCLLNDSFYMDDLVLGINDEAEGVRVFREASTIMKRASMTLRKWNSNSEKIRQVLKLSTFPEVQKVLGLQWFISQDQLAVSLDAIGEFLKSVELKGTKRCVLQAIARIFDPLGILSPSVIRLRILFQQIWRRKLAWDDQLTEDMMGEWSDCVKSIKYLKDMAVPRSVLDMSSAIRTHIHIFADASIKAYGTVAYVWSENRSGQIRVEFLCSKSRVAPIKGEGAKEITLPKLELTAAVLAARLGSYLQKNLRVKVEKVWYWSDSQISLSWIQGGIDKWKPFIQNRVLEIRRLTEISAWGHCSRKENPADLLTRGVSGQSLIRSNLWLQGPDWLADKPNSWIKKKPTFEDFAIVTNLFIETKTATTFSKEPLMNYENFSTWRHLLRVTGYIQRFIHLIKFKEKPCSSHLTAGDIDLAEKYWIRYVQMSTFSNDIFALQKKEPLPRSSSIFLLDPFLDTDGMLRLGGRLQLLEDSVDIKHPVILPPTSYISTLIVNECHERTMHGGVNVVLTRLRERFWIIKGRQLVKKLVKRCKLCRKLWGKPVTQPFAPLPRERLMMSRPFENVGIDFAGPLYIKEGSEGSSRKVYIMICTCAVVRAVHLELVMSMSTEDCLMALRRFIARRGVPATIYSDNARTFRRAALELRSAILPFQNEALQGFLSQNRIHWRFIVERAPWWGGFWERLIRTMKNMLKVVLGKALLDFERLWSVVTEAEGIINTRPLTYVSSDPLDISQLTPANFLLGYPKPSLDLEPSLDTIKEKSTPNELRRNWTQRMKYTSMLWKHWKAEYVQLLRSFHENNGKASVQLSQGDVVLVYDSAVPRIHWKLALITAVFLPRQRWKN